MGHRKDEATRHYFRTRQTLLLTSLVCRNHVLKLGVGWCLPLSLAARSRSYCSPSKYSYFEMRGDVSPAASRPLPQASLLDPPKTNMVRVRHLVGHGVKKISRCRAEVPGATFKPTGNSLRGVSSGDLTKSDQRCDWTWDIRMPFRLAKA